MQQTAFTENNFTTIDSAGDKAAKITRKLDELDRRRPSEDQRSVQHAIDGTTSPGKGPSSFRVRLTAARMSHEG
jgi:hypothetical protein